MAKRFKRIVEWKVEIEPTTFIILLLSALLLSIIGMLVTWFKLWNHTSEAILASTSSLVFVILLGVLFIVIKIEIIFEEV